MLGRDIRLFGREIPGALIIGLLLGLFCAMAALSLAHGTDTAYTAAPVAVVGADESAAGSFAVGLISAQDFSSPLALTQATAEEAEAGLRSGTFSAALYLPENFASDIMRGRQVTARLVVSENAALHADVVDLLCRFGEELLSAGQFGIFAGEPLVWETAPDRYNDFLNQTNLLFIRQAFSDRWFVREEIAFAGTGLSVPEWYGVVYAAVFFSLLILAFRCISIDCETAMLRRLKSSGIGSGIFLLSKFVFLYGLYLLLSVLIFCVLKISPTWFGLLTIPLALGMLLSVGMAIVICLPRSAAVPTATSLAAAGLFCAGGIIPRMELPQTVTLVGDLLPLGSSARLISAGLGGSFSLPAMAACAVWLAVSWAAMVRRLRQLRKGVQQ